MSNEEQELQNKIFSRNLTMYISQSGKTQKEVAQELGFHPTTFNTWCVGKITPSTGKIQRIADYFGITKSDLTDPHFMKPIEVLTKHEKSIIEAYRNAPDSIKDSVLILLGLKERE